MGATRILTTRKGRSVETPFTDNEVLGKLDKLVADKVLTSQFAVDLNWKSAHPKGLSEEQMKWVHILVVDALKAKELEKDKDEIAGLESLIEFFDKAAEGLKKPKVTLEDTEAGKVVIDRGAEGSRYPGWLHVTNGRKWSERGRRYYGRIDRDGRFDYRPSEDNIHKLLVDVLYDFAADPETVAAEHGKRTGRCCFCATEIEHPDSLAVGYGPICAKRYGLPHGGSGIVSPTKGANPSREEA